MNGKSKRYSGKCHCGSISFSFSAGEIDKAMRCSCSICRRKGAYLSDFVIERPDIEFTDKQGSLTRYQFGTGVAKHFFCSLCGIFTHVETRLNPGSIRVNLGCIDGLDVFGLPYEVFDGDSI